MSRLTIDTGTAGNPATGDSLRTAFTKVNTNFTELYAELGGDSLDAISFTNNTISTDITNANLILTGNGTGGVVIEDIEITGSTINTLTTNNNLTLNTNGTGKVIINALSINEINSNDSSAIQVNDGLNVSGNVIPSSDNTYNLGSANSRWKDLHMMDGTIYMYDGIINTYVTITKNTIAKINELIDGGISVQTDNSSNNSVITNSISNQGVSIQGNSGAPVTVNEIEVTAATITPTTPDTLELVGTTIVDELQVEGNEITPTTNNTYIVLTPTGTGKVSVDDLDIKGTEITPHTDNTNITLSPTGTGRVIFDGGTTQTVSGISLEIHAIDQNLTVSVNCSLATVFKVILDTNVQFVINNLPTGGTVTLIIQQDGGGSRTATFGTESSTAVKFSGGAPTLTAAAGSIDVITIFNDGANYLGEFKGNFIP